MASASQEPQNTGAPTHNERSPRSGPQQYIPKARKERPLVGSSSQSRIKTTFLLKQSKTKLAEEPESPKLLALAGLKARSSTPLTDRILREILSKKLREDTAEVGPSSDPEKDPHAKIENEWYLAISRETDHEHEVVVVPREDVGNENHSENNQDQNNLEVIEIPGEDEESSDGCEIPGEDEESSDGCEILGEDEESSNGWEIILKNGEETDSDDDGFVLI